MKKLLIVILFYLMQTSAFADTTAVIGIPWCIYNQTTIKPCANITDVQSDILVGFSNISSDTVTINTLGVGTTNPTRQVHVELRGDDNFFVDGRTNERTITLGAYRQEHTAGTSGTRAINLDIDTNNQYDTHAINVNFVATGVSGNDYNHIYDLHLDTANSTGGEIGGYVCSKTGTGTASFACLDAYVDVAPIEQHSGTLTQAEAAFLYDGAFDNVTAEFRSNSNNATLFVNNGDYIYIGDSGKFDDIEFDLASFADGAGIKPTFEFSEGAGVWASLSAADGTNGFRQNGNVRWTIEPLTTWAVDTVNGVANKYWVRILRNQNNVTSPTEKTVKIISSTIYFWDKDGNLDINTLTVTPFTKHHDITPADVVLGVTGPSTDTIGIARGLGFDLDAEEVYYNVEVPSEWVGTSNFVINVKWASTTAIGAGETVKWDLQWRTVAEGEDIDAVAASTATATYTQSGGGTAGEKIDTAISIAYDDATNPIVVGDSLFFQFDRDVTADTYGGKAVVFDWDVEYSANSISTH